MMPTVDAAQAARGAPTREDPSGVALDADVAIRSSKAGFSSGMLGDFVARDAQPTLASISGFEQGETAVQGVSKHQSFLCIPPRHGVEEYGCTGVVVNPSGFKRIERGLANPSRRSNGHGKPMAPIRRRRPKGGGGGVGCHPLHLRPGFAIVQGLTHPPIGSGVPNVVFRQHIQRSNGTWNVPSGPCRLRLARAQSHKAQPKQKMALLHGARCERNGRTRGEVRKGC